MHGKRPTVSSLHGIVAAAHPLAAQAGATILGITTLAENAFELFEKGETSIEEVYSILFNSYA